MVYASSFKALRVYSNFPDEKILNFLQTLGKLVASADRYTSGIFGDHLSI